MEICHVWVELYMHVQDEKLESSILLSEPKIPESSLANGECPCDGERGYSVLAFICFAKSPIRLNIHNHCCLRHAEIKEFQH